MFRRSLILSALLAVGFAASAQAQLQDRVYGATGTATSGNISGMTAAEVSMGSIRKPANEIRRIEFGGEPRDLTAARQQAQKGQYENAVESLGKIDRGAVKRSYIAQDILFYEAFSKAKLALRGSGDKREAATLLNNFRTKFKDSYHFYDACELYGEIAVASNEYAAAEAAFKELQAAPWTDYKMKASVLAGRALLAQNKFTEALAEFDKVISQAVNSAEALRQQRFAKVGKAVALAETGKVEDGVKMVTTVIAENDPQDQPLMGRAYNALGRCHLKADRQMDALLAYLHVDLLFFNEPDIHAESLYYLRNLWQKANKQNRAVEAKNLLESRYAGTRWATKS